MRPKDEIDGVLQSLGSEAIQKKVRHLLDIFISAEPKGSGEVK
jgi:hypothetical protein